jgi:hypothetical protein
MDAKIENDRDRANCVAFFARGSRIGRFADFS